MLHAYIETVEKLSIFCLSESLFNGNIELDVLRLPVLSLSMFPVYNVGKLRNEGVIMYILEII